MWSDGGWGQQLMRLYWGCVPVSGFSTKPCRQLLRTWTLTRWRVSKWLEVLHGYICVSSHWRIHFPRSVLFWCFTSSQPVRFDKIQKLQRLRSRSSNYINTLKHAPAKWMKFGCVIPQPFPTRPIYYSTPNFDLSRSGPRNPMEPMFFEPTTFRPFYFPVATPLCYGRRYVLQW